MARKRNTRSTGAFVLGGVVGGVVGAAVTLWNTPKSGPELRAGFSSNQPTGPSATVVDTAPRGTRFDNPVLSFVERAAAPIVGVELGKLAKDDAAPASVSAPVSPVVDRPAADPEVGQHAPTMDELTHPQTLGDVSGTSSQDTAPLRSTAADTVDPEEGQHVATMEELTRPQGDPPPDRA